VGICILKIQRGAKVPTTQSILRNYANNHLGVFFKTTGRRGLIEVWCGLKSSTFAPPSCPVNTEWFMAIMGQLAGIALHDGCANRTPSYR